MQLPVNHRPRPGGSVNTRTRAQWPTTVVRPGGTLHLATTPTGTVNRPPQPPLPVTTTALFAHFAGAGQLTTAIFPKHRATPGLGGEGTLDVVTIPRIPLAAGFGGAGTLSLLIETVGGDPARDIPLTGEGTLDVAALPRMNADTADATGSGTLTVAAFPQHDVEGSFYNSDGTLTVDTTPRYSVTAAFAGAGALSGAVVSAAQTAAPFSGAGALSVASNPRHATITSPSGSGALTFTRGRGWDDQFTRANSANLGTGWTQGGTGSGIGVTSNNTSWGNGGGTDGNAWAIRTEDLLTGDHYVRVVVDNASSTRDSRILMHANTGLTAFAYLNWFSNAIYFGRSTGSYTSISDMGSKTSGVSIGGGTVIEFWNAGNVFEAWLDGVQALVVTDSSNLILRDATTRRPGFGQERSTFANSGFIREWQGRDRLANAA